MEQTLSDGRVRRRGLIGKSVVLSERVHPAEGKLEQQGYTARIVDYNGAATTAFTSLPSIETKLTADLSESSTTATVLQSSVLVNGYYHLDTEVVQVTARPTGTTVTLDNSGGRAKRGTSAQRHYATVGDGAYYPSVTNAPITFAGRRALVYEYGPGDSLAGDGQLRMRGVIAAEPSLSEGTTWEIEIDPLSSLLKQEVASVADEELHVTQIYYAWTGPLKITCAQTTTADISTAPTLVASILVSNNFTDQDHFCRSVNAQLVTALSGAGFTTRVEIQPAPDGTWEIWVRQPSANARYVYVYATSAVDGTTGGDSTPYLHNSDGTGPVFSVATDGQYRVPFTATADATLIERGLTPRSPRRACYQPRVGDPAPVTDVETASNINTRIYLDRAASLSVGDVLTVDDEFHEQHYQFQVSAVGTTGYVDVTNLTGVTGYTGVILNNWAGGGPTIKVAKSYGVGTLETFRAELVSDSVEANAGNTPWITSSDCASWATVVAEAAGPRPYLQRRQYVFTKPVELAKLLAEECKLAGLYPYIDGSAKLSLRRLTIPADTEEAIYTIGASDYVSGNGFASIAVSPDNVINVIRVKTGYDREEDKHKGDDFEVRNVLSIGRIKRRRELAIEPKVQADVEPTWEDVVDIAAPIVSLFGNRYDLVSIPVTRLAVLSVLLGDTVEMTIGHVPYAGARGLSAVKGLVIGRELNLGEAFGRLDVLVSTLNVSGYAPSGRISSNALVGGTTYDLTMAARYYDGGSTNDAAGFVAGDKIQVIQFDNSAPSAVAGTVDSVSSPTVRVTLAAAIPSGTCNLMYDDATTVHSGANADDQERYAICAASDGQILGTDPAREFGP